MGLRFGSPIVPTFLPPGSAIGAVLGGDVGLVAATDTLILTSPSLAVGLWLLHLQAEYIVTGAVASDCILYAALGSAVGTFAGPIAADTELPAIATGAAGLALATILTVTTAGTIQLRGQSTLAGTVKALATTAGARAVTGLTAVRIG